MTYSRTKTKRDANQADFILDMKAIGAPVVDLSSVGGGCGDVLVGWNFRNWLFELKDPNQPPSARKPRQSQLAFRASWRGQYDLVETSEAAMQLMGVPDRTINQVTQARNIRKELEKRRKEAEGHQSK